MIAPGSTGTATAPEGRASLLRTVAVDRELDVPPGRQLARQMAVMVREGRLEPGRRLPSTRRLAPVVGLHRNTVAAAYRRLAGRGLVDLRHGARARVPSVVAAPGRDRAGRVVVAAADVGTARVMAAEIRDALPADVGVGTLLLDGDTRLGSGDEVGEGRLVAALPGAALRRMAGESELGSPSRVVRVLQDRRERVREVLLGAPPLAVVDVVAGCPLLREAVRSDAARLRGREISLRAGGTLPRCRAPGREGPAPAADLVIADRLAADAFCGGRPSPSGPDVVRVRLLCPESLAAVSSGAGGTGARSVGDRDP